MSAKDVYRVHVQFPNHEAPTDQRVMDEPRFLTQEEATKRAAKIADLGWLTKVQIRPASYGAGDVWFDVK